ncbi:AsmA family protein [Entomomonas asaccharolytica]|uniref:AsmA family protein n=1 Tax=Entomomonas asaccharolytica TaxID=2785331 RepID=A0A974RX03_9GAMM|nr:AsmA family protein [Entomomonas asaccharolytica]QQP85731.1 AsmA family protein [Entomomonas asaccharolytica]
MKAIKYLSYFIIGLVVLVLLLFFGLILFFNPNNYKAEIQNLVKEKANMELKIDGDISWTFYPWLGISIQNTSAASVESPDKPFAQVKELDLSVKLLPLFKGQIQMNDVNIDGLVVDLEKDAQGKTNWDKVGQTATTGNTQTTTDKPTTEQPKESTGSGKIDLDVNSITINNTKIMYRDLKTGQDYTINDVHLSTGTIRIGEPITVKLGANLKSAQPKLSTTVNLQGQLVYDLDAQHYEVQGLDLASDITGDILNGKTASFTAKGDLVADLKANTAAWNKLSLTLDDLKISGSINAANITGDVPTVKGVITADTFNLRKVLTDIGIALPEMADSNALTKVGFSTNLSGSTKAVALNDLKIKLDNTNFTGSVAVTDLAKQAIKVKLTGDSINVDNYLPPEAKQAAQNTKATTTTTGTGKTVTVNQPVWSNDPMFDPASLRGLDIDADLTINQLTVKKLPWQGFGVKLTAKNSVINLQNVGGKLFTGAINVKGSINASSNTPQITIQPTISNIPIDKLLASQDMKDIPIRGNLNFNGNIRTAGVSQAALVKTLNGNANFVVNDGALIGENFEYQVCRAVALVRKESLTSQFNRTETKFNQLKGSVNITNGVASNQDLIISIAGFETKGKGTFNVSTMMIDYQIALALKGEQDVSGDPACKVNQDVAGIDFPLLCKGSVLAGGGLCGIDTGAIGQMALEIGKNKAKEEINKALDKEKDKLNKKLEDKLGDKAPNVQGILKGILNK